jgi:hypothetical protein
MMRIAFQGTEGAYSEEASLKAFPGAQTIGLPTFHQVFSAVTEGEVDLGVVPVENTTAGIINQTTRGAASPYTISCKLAQARTLASSAAMRSATSKLRL